MAYYIYRLSDGQFAGSGITPIRNATHDHTTVAPPAQDEEETPLYWDGATWGDTPSDPHQAPEPAEYFPPAPAPRWSPLDFLSRFTQAEQAAIEASESITVRLVKTQLLAASEIIADDPRTVAGMAALVSEGILTQARHDEILSNS